MILLQHAVTCSKEIRKGVWLVKILIAVSQQISLETVRTPALATKLDSL